MDLGYADRLRISATGVEVIMRYVKYLAMLGVFVVLAATPSPAQVSIGVHIGRDYGYSHVPPACPYGYYPDYPFGCAPYGYWGPQYFVNGVFIGVGPWSRFYYRQPVLYQRWYGPGYVYFPREHFYRYREDDWDDDDDRGNWHFNHNHGWHRDHGWHGRKHHHHHDDDDD